MRYDIIECFSTLLCNISNLGMVEWNHTAYLFADRLVYICDAVGISGSDRTQTECSKGREA